MEASRKAKGKIHEWGGLKITSAMKQQHGWMGCISFCKNLSKSSRRLNLRHLKTISFSDDIYQITQTPTRFSFAKKLFSLQSVRFWIYIYKICINIDNISKHMTGIGNVPGWNIFVVCFLDWRQKWAKNFIHIANQQVHSCCCRFSKQKILDGFGYNVLFLCPTTAHESL